MESDYDIRGVQELCGHKSVNTTMIPTHVLNPRGKGASRAALVPIVAALLVASGCCSHRSSGADGFVPQAGDLLFQDLDGSPFCDAVERVTQGHGGADITHVAIVARDLDGGLFVLEAVKEGVVATSLDTFLGRSRDANGRPKVLVGRLRRAYRHLIPTAVAEASSLKGKPYDRVFDLHNDAYYCSELIYLCFRNANGGTPVFDLGPMTFVDPDTQETFPAWKTYFAELAVPIPEGKPGLNPGGISRSPVLHIVHAYGIPAGWKGKR